MTPVEQAILFVLIPATLVYIGAAFLFRIGLARLHTEPVDHESPFVSVVIAARDEEDYIGACLDSLSTQTYPHDRFEVIVVDDDSSDQTFHEASRRPVASVIRPDARFDDHAAKKRPMATGIAHAKGDIILTTDADCTVPAGWIEAMVTTLTSQTDVVVGFSQIKHASSPGSLWDRLQALDFLALLAAAAGSTGLGSALAATGQNFGFRKSIFRQVGGYEDVKHRASGDDVLLLQLFRRKANARSAFCTARESFVSTWRSETPVGYLRQRRRWASNAGAQLRLNPVFFLYILAVFATHLTIPVALVLGGALAYYGVTALIAKLVADAVVLVRGATLFDRRDLLTVLPLWELLQPVYIVLVGITGTLFGYTWKSRHHTHRSSSTDLDHATM